MTSIKSPAYLSNPHCQAYEKVIQDLGLAWINQDKSGPPRDRAAAENALRAEHSRLIALAEEARHKALSCDRLMVVEYWGEGEDNNYYIDLVQACAECRGKPAVPGRGGFCSDACAAGATGDY